MATAATIGAALTQETKPFQRSSCPCLDELTQRKQKERESPTVAANAIVKELHEQHQLKRKAERGLIRMRDVATRSLAEKKRVWAGQKGRFSRKRLEDWYLRMQMGRHSSSKVGDSVVAN